jgi:hypothetical protein
MCCSRRATGCGLHYLRKQKREVQLTCDSGMMHAKFLDFKVRRLDGADAPRSFGNSRRYELAENGGIVNSQF